MVAHDEPARVLRPHADRKQLTATGHRVRRELHRRDRQAIARRDPDPLGLAGRKLENGPGTALLRLGIDLQGLLQRDGEDFLFRPDGPGVRTLFQVRAEAAAAQRDLLIGVGVAAQHLCAAILALAVLALAVASLTRTGRLGYASSR